MRVGVDTGGTFTDFVWLQDGQWRVHKQRSTPVDPSQAILQGIEMLAIPEAAAVVHGSTVATNALLERRGARTALLTTRGFADVLALGRQNRPDLYALVPQKPPPLVPRALRFEVEERIDAGGNVLTPLTDEALDALLARLRAAHAAAPLEAIAICLLFSFLNPVHERRLAAAIGDAFGPDGPALSLSADILPEYREFERTATTVINAYVAPKMGRYLARLQQGVAPRSLTIMQSSGGLIAAAQAGREAARTALSGPAGGVVGAFFVAQQAGYDQVITLDMGGTSTDVALCPGRVVASSASTVAGLPLRLPAIDIHTVGAGGGSIAAVDAGGALRVGPESAGADPGPACYPRVHGSQNEALQPTVTDANLMLGRLHADHFLGGTMRLAVEPARSVMGRLAQAMGAPDVRQAAMGVIRVANANMERAIRKISVERGYDPRLFTLVPFGGAGPLHACDLAEALQIPRVLVPPVPGVLSALGMLVAAPQRDYARTALRPAADDDTATTLMPAYAPLVSRALADMRADGHPAAAVTLRHGVDMRYQGQSHELTLWLDVGGERLVDAFHAAHAVRYGYARRDATVELVTLRLQAVVEQPPPVVPEEAPVASGDGSAAVFGREPVVFGGRAIATKLVDRARLRAGERLLGPAVIFQYDTTTVLPPGWTARVDRRRNLILERHHE